MKNRIFLLALAGLMAGCGKLAEKKTPEAAAEESKYLSPEVLAVAPNGGLYVTAATGSAIIETDLAGAALRMWKIVSHCAEKEVPINPTGIAVGPEAVYVTAGVQCGEVQEYKKDGTFVRALEVGHAPCAPVLSADGKSLFVFNRFTARLVEVDLAAWNVKRTTTLLREITCAVKGAGGKLLFAANLIPACASTNDVVAAAISVVCTKDFSVKNILLANGSTGVRGITSSNDGKFIYVTHTMGRYQLPTTQLERGWMNTAAMSVLDGETGAYVNTFLLDDSDRGAANPWGCAVSGDGKWLCVNHAGTDEMSVIDRNALHERLKKAEHGESVSGIVKSAADVSNDLAFLNSIRRRVALKGCGPRGLVFVGNVACAALYFEDAIACVEPTDVTGNVRHVRVGPKQDITHDRVRRGAMLYHSGTMCFQQWQSCSSCHPDGRVDGLNWDLLNDGVGNPKQTKSQLYGQFTAPTMATGIRPDMKACNRAGLIHIQFVQRPEEDALCLDAYTESLTPVPSPYLVKGELSEKAKRGKVVYEKANCALCHGDQTKTPAGASLYTDCKLYDVGLGEATEKGRKFDTPALTEVWRTAPYLYDGRAYTMREVLTTCNPEDKHGITQSLSAEEIEDLAEYVLSL